MRQGNGTEILGPNDPRAASIGIIHVSPTDDRRSVLAAIITQEKLGRKQVAVVLPPQNKAFQRPADFDALKNMRNRLQPEVVFIASTGPGPGEFARQRRFPVYSSLDSYAQALREEEPTEELPKRGWFGELKPKATEAPPPQESVLNTPRRGSRPEPESSQMRPRQPRITGDLSKVAPAAPMPPLQPMLNPNTLVGQQYGNYRLLSFIEKGNVGEVYLGEHVLSKQKAAIKVFRHRKGLYDIEYFQNSINDLSRLRHPNIVHILEAGIKDDDLFVVMEHMANGTLYQRHKGTVLPIAIILPYIKQITIALQYIHNNKVVHQHIRPDKLFLSENNVLLLGGIEDAAMRITDPESSEYDLALRLSNYISPASYISPETIQGHPVSASDQYALGIIVYEWLSGELPFRSNRANSRHNIMNVIQDILTQHIHTPPPSLREKVPTISPTIERVVMKALSKDPKDRYESIQAFTDALEQAALIAQQLGSYRLIQHLGGGGIGNVYRGEHVDLGTKVAIKVLRSHIDEVAFQNGVRRIARLMHPNIVRIVESGAKDNMFFLIMDYIPYGTLKQRHANDKSLPLTTVVEYVKQVAAALQEAHDHNVLLGNVRPENMLVSDNNEVLLSGFDTVLMDNVKGGDIVIGHYTAPEQVKGIVLPASDQYALAAIVYEWLSGEPPLAFSPSENGADKASRLVSTPPAPLRSLAPTLPQELEDVVMKALAKDPRQRFASVEDFAKALEEASEPRNEPKIHNRAGQTFGSYRLTRLLGRGGFADVYLGQHTLMGTYAAVKVLHAQLMGEYAERFRNEARTIANLRHPAIVRVLGYGVEGDTPFLVMDRAKETLRDRHPQGSVLPPKVILPYVKQVAAALQYAHNQRLIHRDIKPENMLIGPRNEVLLSDFGIATVVHQTSVKNTQSIAGTAIYMAPEQFRRRIHIASDQYSLGIVVYEWLCGQPPFTEGDFIQLGFQHNSDPPPSLRGKVPSLSPDVEKVVMIALAKDPTQRFASIQAFANALEQACK